ncbi:MAG: hypothetical protein JF626_02485, partial [Polaromonas sp.]|nr:hypothetical protein [Polaromonas sp.]
EQGALREPRIETSAFHFKVFPGQADLMDDADGAFDAIVFIPSHPAANDFTIHDAPWPELTLPGVSRAAGGGYWRLHHEVESPSDAITCEL